MDGLFNFLSSDAGQTMIAGMFVILTGGAGSLALKLKTAVSITNGLVDAIEDFKNPQTDFSHRELSKSLERNIPPGIDTKLNKIIESRKGDK